LPNPKQHHYVTRAYLDFFNDPKFNAPALLWMADKNEKRIIKTSSSNVAKQNHFYSVEHEGEKRADIETALSQLESEAVPILKKINSQNFEITEEEKVHLALFFASTMLRVPAWRNFVEKMHKEIVEKMMAATFSTPGALEGIQKQMEEEGRDVGEFGAAEMREYYKNNRDNFEAIIDPIVSLRPLSDMLEEIGNRFFQMNWTILIAPVAHAFITSDNPPVVHNPHIPRDSIYGSGIGQRGAEITFPLSPTLCLLMTHEGKSNFRSVDGNEIWEINTRTFSSATRFIFCSSWERAWRAIQGVILSAQAKARPPWMPFEDPLPRNPLKE
jgi:hypothetical protein